MLKTLCAVVCLVLLVGSARAATLNVGQAGSGAPYTSIQAAIDAANNGDTVLVAMGTYYENIDFKGKAITVTSSGGAAKTTINGGASIATVTFQTKEQRNSVIDGFTITNGGGGGSYSDPTGGIFVSGASPTISNNTITANHCSDVSLFESAALVEYNEINDSISPDSGYGYCLFDAGSAVVIDGYITLGTQVGPVIYANTIENNNGPGSLQAGGIFLWGGTSLILDNIIRNNMAGGISSANTNAVSIIQNLIYGNTSNGGGGGVDLLPPDDSTGPFVGLLVNNTIAGNTVTSYEAGETGEQVLLEGNLGQYAVVNNLIIGSSNVVPAMTCGTGYSYLMETPLVFDHNDVYNAKGAAYGGACPNQTGSYGNISYDPMFANPSTGNYQLLAGSQAIDTGNNSAPLLQNLDLQSNGRIQDATNLTYPVVDMGAYELAGKTDSASATFLTLTPLIYYGYPNPITSTPETFTITLTASSGKPTGLVTVFQDGVNIGTVLVPSSGTAILSNPAITPGLHAYIASFAGSESFAPAVSVKFYLLIPNFTTNLNLQSSPSSYSVVGQAVTFTVTASSSNASFIPSPIVLADLPQGSATPTTLQTLMPDSSGVASYVTSTLVEGLHTISASYAGDATHDSATVSIRQNVSASNLTTVAVSSSPTQSTVGQSVTFTAQVTTSVTGQGSPAGSIVFTYLSTVLGTMPIDSTGSASLSTNALPIGSDVITATYQPSNAFAVSSNMTTEMVQGLPQTITFSQPAPAYVATSVLLAATASSGLPVTYSVVSGPATVSGSVLTYTGAGNVVVEADQVGDATYAAAPAAQSLPIVASLLEEPVGTTSVTVTTVVTFSSAGTLGSVAVLTQGATGLDFAQVTGGSCAVGTTYAVGQNCTVEFSFTPTRPGQRYGGIVLSTSAGAMLANSYVYGVGVGPQIGWLPGTQTLVGSGLVQPSGVAVDGSGNAFVSQLGGSIVEIAPGGTQRTIASLPLTNDVAVDGSGNLFVIDDTNVYEVPAVNGVITASATAVTVAVGFDGLGGIAVDATGNVFVAGNAPASAGAVYELAAINGVIPASPVARMLGSGFGSLSGVAVDSSGDVFVSDFGKQAVDEIEAVNGVIGTSPVIRALGGTLSAPSNVGLDAANDVYVTDDVTGLVSEFMAVNGAVPTNPTIRTVGSGIVQPEGMVVDSNGNIFVADKSITQIVKLDYADPPSLTFAPTVVGSSSSDSPQTVTISNDGNYPLTFTAPASTTSGFPIGSGSTCLQSTPTQPLNPGDSCTEQISFTPVAIGVDNGVMTVTDNAVGLTQTVLLNGTGVAATTMALQSSQNPQGVGMPVTFTATVTSTGGTPTGSVTFSDGSTVLGSGTLTGGVAIYTTSSLTMGVHTITATYAATTDFEQSSGSLMQTIGYQSVTTTVDSPEPSLYGQPVVFSVHVAGASGSTGIPSGTVQIVFCRGATGTATLDANGNGFYEFPTAGGVSEDVGSCPYTAHYLGDTHFFPSASTSTPYVVNPAASTTTVAAAPNPGYLGQAVTLSAQVTGTPSPTLGPGGVTLQPGSQVATGTVQFYDGGVPIGNAVALNGAQAASLVTNALTLGPHTITAKYSGDTNLSGSISTGVSETIQLAGTATTLIVAPNPGVQYETETMLVSVAALAGLAPPTGQVMIYDDATPLVTLPLSSVNGTVASVTYTTNTLAVGPHTLMAKYSPGPCAAVICALYDFTPSESTPPVSLLIQPQDFTITANPPSITIQTEHHASMPLTLTAIGQFNGPIYLSCAGAVPKWVTCEFPNSPVSLTGTAPQATTFTIDTDALLDYKSETRGVSSRVVLAGLLPVMLLGFVRRRKLRGLVLVAIVSVMAMAMTACSGQYPAHTEPGTYTVAVQAYGQVVGASVPTVHTLDVTLVVTP